MPRDGGSQLLALLLAEAEWRLAAFGRDDATGVLAPDSVALAEELVEAAVRDARILSPQGLRTAALIHHCRGLSEPQPDARRDAARRAGQLAFILGLDLPDLVPETLRPLAALAAVQAGAELLGHAQRSGQPEALDASITASRLALAWGGERMQLPAQVNLGTALASRFEVTGQQPDLYEAISSMRSALPIATDHVVRRGLINNLGTALRSRFERTGARADIDEALALLQTLAEGDISPVHLANLGQALMSRFEAFGDHADLHATVQAARRAAADTSAGDPEEASRLSGLGSALRMLFEVGGQVEALHESVTVHRRAAAVPQGHPQALGIAVNLGNALRTRFEHCAVDADLDEAIEVTARAVAAAPDLHPGRARYLSNLGAMLRTRFERRNDPADLDAAIEAHTRAVDTAAVTDPHRGRYLANLSATFSSQHERTGQADALGQAIAYGRQAVEQSTASSLDRARCQSNLATALVLRYDLHGVAADLDEAIAAVRRAAADVGDGHVDRPRYLTNLAGSLQAKFVRTEADTDLNEAVAAARAAVAATNDDSADLAGRLSNFSIVLQTRFSRHGDPADLDEAISAGARSMASTGPSHPTLQSRQSNLGLARLRRFERRRDPEDLQAAVTLGAQAVESAPPGGPGQCRSLVNLGSALEARADYLRLESARPAAQWVGDLLAARDAWSRAAAMPAAPAGVRVIAANAWGRTAARLMAWPDAADAYDKALQHLQALAWHGAQRTDQEYAIAGWSGLVRDAAACSVAANRGQAAMRQLEAGRGVLWSQTLNQRTDLARLQAVQHDLAEALHRVRGALEDLPPDESTPLNP